VSSVQKVGVRLFMDDIIKYFPAHCEKESIPVKTVSGEDKTIQPSASGALVAQVFKTIVDPFVGKISMIKVVSGTLTSDSTVYNPKKDKSEKIGNLFLLKGKQQINVSKLSCGDIGAVAKLTVTETNDTLCSKENPVIVPETAFPKPMLSMAILPKAKGDEDKIGNGLHRLLEEDPTFKMELNTETKQTLIYGMGDQHLDVITSKLKNKFKVEVDLVNPIIPYRRPSRKRLRLKVSTRSRAVAMASSAMSGLSSSRVQQRISPLKKKSSAVLFPSSISLQLKRVFVRVCKRVCWRAIPWLT
jgi:elongation factor G